MCSLDGSKVALFSEADQVTTKSEPRDSNNYDSDPDASSMAYEPLPHMMNVNLSNDERPSFHNFHIGELVLQLQIMMYKF